MSIIVIIISKYLEIESIAFSKIDASNKLIIIAFIITLKTRDFHDLFKNRVVFLDDIIIDDNVSKYELSANKYNKNNIDFLIIIEKEKVER